jgi:hypothetical protein
MGRVLLLLAMMSGQVFAQDSRKTSQPVGIQTLTYQRGFNYLGLQLIGRVEGTANVAGVNGVNVVVENTDDRSRDGTFIFEISGGAGDGIVTTASVMGRNVVTDDDLSSRIDHSSKVTFREIQTLASVFGETNRVNLASGGSFGTCDQIWIPDGKARFEKYAYLVANPFTQQVARWEDSHGNLIDPKTVTLIYTDAIIINAVAANDLLLTGFIKLGKTSFALTTTFNYLSSVYPGGLTLGGSNFKDTFTSTGIFGPWDQLWLPNGAGGFDKYAYIQGNGFTGRATGWYDELGIMVDPENISIVSTGIIIFRALGHAKNVICDAPDFYDSL